MLIYKYRSIKRLELDVAKKPEFELVKEILKTGKFYHSSPDRFNDVFDMDPLYRAEFNQEEVEVFLKRYVFEYPKNKDKVDLMMSHRCLNSINQEKENQNFDEMVEKAFKKSGVCSFSENINSPYLWGVYADGGKGVAIEIDIPNEQLGKTFYKVRYANSRCEISAYECYFSHENPTYRNEIIGKIVSAKSMEWLHEAEIRSVNFVNTNCCLSVCGEIKSIIYGPKCKQEDYSDIKRIFSKYKHKRTKLSKAQYTIEILD